jgi:uncharacterized membrane protein
VNPRRNASGDRTRERHAGFAKTREEIRHAFAEFLTLPAWIIGGFLLLAAVSYALDRAEIAGLGTVREMMRRQVFADAPATSDLLGVVAGSVITMTSITFSLVLLAVQQAAGSLTFQVIDQFLRRRLNQIAFGFFVGLALYALAVLVTVSATHIPVYGATLALLLTMVALCLLLLLLFTTINQMRPVEIVDAIHDRTLGARQRQLPLLRATRPVPRLAGAIAVPVPTEDHGFVVRVDVGPISAAAQRVGGEVEVVLLVTVGTFVAFQDVIAEVRAPTAAAAAAVGKAVQAAIRVERHRDLDTDPAFGIEQLATIAWTSISTSKSNPAPGLAAIRSLRDLMAHWSLEEGQATPSGDGQAADDSPSPTPPAPVVYADDVFPQLLDAFESLAVCSTESMQHQCFAEIARTFAVMFDRLPAAQRPRAEDLIQRIISGLGDHVLTAELDAALAALVGALERAGSAGSAAAVTVARARLQTSVGTLNSRATRVPSA